MAGVAIRIEGDREVSRQLVAAAERLEHPRALWDEIGRSLVVSTQQRFETESDPNGNPWPKSIRALTSGKTLTDSAAMRNSITHEATDQGVAVGTNAIQAAVHQFGATIRAKSSAGLTFKIGDRWVHKQSVEIPRRAFLGLSEADEADLLEIAAEFVAAPVGGANAG